MKKTRNVMQHSSVPASTSEMSHHVWWLWQPEKETIFFIFLKYNLVEMTVLFMKSTFKIIHVSTDRWLHCLTLYVGVQNNPLTEATCQQLQSNYNVTRVVFNENLTNSHYNV